MGNLVFPINIAGAMPNLRRKPMFSTDVQTSANGMEVRASWQSYPRYKYTLSIEMLRSDAVYQEFQRVASAFASTLGQYDTFLIVDPNDSVVTNMGFGVTNGSATAYQLQRTLGGVEQVGYWDPTTYPINTLPRTNYLLQSQTIDNAAWTKNNITIGVNASSAPDGSATADSIIESSTTSVQHFISQSIAGLTSVGRTFTLSAYVNAARPMCILQLSEATGGTLCSVWYNLQTGAVGASATGINWASLSASIVPAGGGWNRVTLTAQNTNSATGFGVNISSATIDGVVSYAGTAGNVAAYIWGTQLEVGATATSYLSTLTLPSTDTPAYWPNFGDGFEPITEVNAGLLKIYLSGVLQVNGANYTYSGSGLINFTSTPAAGQGLSWSGNYFRRVRFAADDLELDRIFGQLWSGKTINLISVK